MATTILRLPAVKARTGLSRSTIYLHVSDGSFPRPVSLGARAVGWVESDIEEWISRKILESRGGGTLAQTQVTP
jgi:prophage regulatory protein